MLPGTSLITVLALIVYFGITVNVSRTRVKFKIPAPQISGNPYFERSLRIQQNTVEQLILFLPSLWLFSSFVSPVWANVIGSVWIISRIVYAFSYYQAPEKRTVGFAISALMVLILLIGSLVGIVITLLKTGF
jgi:glutathione S-transferase